MASHFIKATTNNFNNLSLSLILQQKILFLLVHYQQILKAHSFNPNQEKLNILFHFVSMALFFNYNC